MKQVVKNSHNVFKEYDISGLTTIQTVQAIEPCKQVKSRELVIVNGKPNLAYKNDFYIGEKVILVKTSTIFPDIDLFQKIVNKKCMFKTYNLEDVILTSMILPLNILEHPYYGYKLVETIKPDNTELKYIWKHFPNGSRQEIILTDGLDIGKILCIKRDTKLAKGEFNET